jgi:hypothetical protein
MLSFDWISIRLNFININLWNCADNGRYCVHEACQLYFHQATIRLVGWIWLIIWRSLALAAVSAVLEYNQQAVRSAQADGVALYGMVCLLH